MHLSNVEGFFTMSTTLLVILIAVVVIAAVAIWAWVQKQRTRTLRSRFGPEYQRAIQEYGNRSSAEKALEHRAERTEMYHLRLLTEQERHAFSEDRAAFVARQPGQDGEWIGASFRRAQGSRPTSRGKRRRVARHVRPRARVP